MSEIICFCNNVSEERIRQAIRDEGLKNVKDVQDATGAGSGCGVCTSEIRMILKDELSKPRSAARD